MCGWPEQRCIAKTSMLKREGLSFFLSMTLIATASPVRRSTARHTEPVPPLARHDLKSYSASTSALLASCTMAGRLISSAMTLADS